MLILASASPRRKKLLKTLKIPFRIHPSGIKEKTTERQPGKKAVEAALSKARAVARKFPKSLVLGADTIVVCKGKTLLKPAGLAEAKGMLKTLNGQWHRVYTGLALVKGNKKWTAISVSRCKARRLPLKQLERFAGRHMDKAGGYAVQDRKDPFIEKVVGPIDNVVGFPRETFLKLWCQACLSCFSHKARKASLAPSSIYWTKNE